MGLFSKPKCPRCGGPITATGYSFPFPQYRCRNCIAKNQQDKRIKELEKQVADIKKQNPEP
jgi:tRNA(Ile2) C34 agmatinyltransferase TiaS